MLFILAILFISVLVFVGFLVYAATVGNDGQGLKQRAIIKQQDEDLEAHREVIRELEALARKHAKFDPELSEAILKHVAAFRKTRSDI